MLDWRQLQRQLCWCRGQQAWRSKPGVPQCCHYKQIRPSGPTMPNDIARQCRFLPRPDHPDTKLGRATLPALKPCTLRICRLYQCSGIEQRDTAWCQRLSKTDSSWQPAQQQGGLYSTQRSAVYLEHTTHVFGMFQPAAQSAQQPPGQHTGPTSAVCQAGESKPVGPAGVQQALVTLDQVLAGQPHAQVSCPIASKLLPGAGVVLYPAVQYHCRQHRG